MKELTVTEIKEKLEKVEGDLMRADSENARTVLASYIEYLKDELKEAERNELRR